MTKKRNIYFWTALIIFAAAMFILNRAHVNQQGTYENIFKPIAESLFTGEGYNCEELGGGTLFYPMWGYNFLVGVLGLQDYLVLIAQFLLCLFSISIFYKMFDLTPRYWHILLFLPFIALMSVKWPDAVVGSLLIFYAYYFIRYLDSRSWKDILISGIVFGVLANFRSEYFFLPLFLILLVVLPRFKNRRKTLVSACLAVFAIQLIFLLPWAIRYYNHNGEFKFVSTNGGAVFYISLGQAPDNPWGIVPLDKTAYDIAEREKFDNPYSPKADAYFRSKAKENIAEYPWAYTKKVARNIAKAFTGGVYTGEYANFFIGVDRRLEIEEELAKRGGKEDKLKYVLDLPFKSSFPIAVEKAIQGAFAIIFLAALMIFFASFFKMKDQRFRATLAVVAGMLIYKILSVGLIQYEYRHMNAVYLLIFGGGMIYLTVRDVKKRK